MRVLPQKVSKPPGSPSRYGRPSHLEDIPRCGVRFNTSSVQNLATFTDTRGGTTKPRRSPSDRDEFE